MPDSIPKIALVGNPNSGKSSLFNHLTGLNQKIGNFPGVTVDKKTGSCELTPGHKAEIIDLPGTYSIYPNSKDEQIVFDILVNDHNPLHPDIVVVIADASNFKRNLLLFTQIYDLGIPVVLALNMIDLAEKSGQLIDHELLSRELGIPVIPMRARTGVGLVELKKSLAESVPAAEKPLFDVNEHCKEGVARVKEHFNIQSDYRAYQILQQFRINKSISDDQKQWLENLSEEVGFQSHELRRVETLTRYQRINEFVNRSVRQSKELLPKQWTERLDRVFTHKIWGYVIFFIILLVIFQAIFAWATVPMDFIDHLFSE